VHELGRGGMGTVFEAEQHSMGRRVALKVLPFAALAQDKSLQRFRNEVRAAAALDHPNIVSVYSIGEDRGVHYYAMQLVRGQTLADMIQELRASHRAPLLSLHSQCEGAGNEPTVNWSATSPSTKRDEQARINTAGDSRRDAESYRTAARLGIQAAEALQHAHDQGVLHRDIKPSNLMLDRDGKLYVTDFGLARIEADAGMTMTGDILGTLRYMAPEQALAKRVVIDHRADIYSLGATLYELLTLQPAFCETDRSELLKRIAFGEACPLRKVDARIPVELETIVLKAMSKTPDERYHSAQELSDDLKAFLEDRPIKAKPPTPLKRVAKWSRRHRWVLIAAASVLILFAIGSMVSTTMLLWERERTEFAAAESKAVVDFLINDLFTAAEDSQLVREVTVNEVLANADKKVAASLANQPQVESKVRHLLAKTYFALGKYEDAEKQIRRAYAISQQANGRADPNTLATANTTVQVLINLGRLSEARRCAEEFLSTSLQYNGDDSPETANCKKSLAIALRAQGKFEASRELLAEVLEWNGKTFGPHHPSCVEIRFELAHTLMNLDKFKDALRLVDDTIELSDGAKKIDPRLLLKLKHLRGNILIYLPRREDARAQFEENLLAERQTLPPGDPMTVGSMYWLAWIYDREGKAEQARKMIDEALRLAGPFDWGVRARLSNLLATAKSAGVRDGQRSLRIATQACELTNYEATLALTSLAAAYTEMGDLDAATKWSRLAIEITDDPGRRQRYESQLSAIRELQAGGSSE